MIRLRWDIGRCAGSDIVDMRLVADTIGGLGEPVDGCGQAAAETFQTGIQGLPADKVCRFPVVTPQAFDLGYIRAQVGVFGFNLNVDIHQLCDGVGSITDRDFEIGADVHDFTNGTIGFCGRQKAGNRIADICEITVGAVAPRRMVAGPLRGSCAASWVMIVGITARADWRGP